MSSAKNANERALTIQGKAYDSITDAARSYDLTVQLVSRRLKAGWTAEQAVGISEPPKRIAPNMKELKTSRGIFKSVREASKISGVSEANINARLKLGWSHDQACGFSPPPKRRSNNAKKIQCNGKIFDSKAALASAYNLPYRKLIKRLLNGWTPEQAVGLDAPPPRYRNSDGSKRSHSWANPQRTSEGKLFAGSKDGKYLLYAINNKLNGKSYIGITTTTLSTRWYHHKKSAEEGTGSSHSKLYNAMRKFGAENFSITLLRDDAKSVEELLEQEVSTIRELDTIRGGYNTSRGGTIGTGKAITVAGRKFDSYGQAAAFFGVAPTTFALRISRLEWTPEQAAEVEERPTYGRRNIKHSVTTKDGIVTFNSVAKAADHFGIQPKTVHARLKRGWTLTAACTTPLNKNKKID